jgi:hypothetical protein
MKFYQEVNIPKIPENLLNLTAKDGKIINDIGYGHSHKKSGVNVKSCTYASGLISHQPLIDWLLLNIGNIGYQSYFQIQGDGTHIVHSDLGRVAGLNYIIDTGGENVVTSWYQEKNKPLKRVKKIGRQQADDGFVDYQNLETLESVILQKNKWYLIDTGVLHDVDNIQTMRKSITINIQNQDQFDQIKYFINQI